MSNGFESEVNVRRPCLTAGPQRHSIRRKTYLADAVLISCQTSKSKTLGRRDLRKLARRVEFYMILSSALAVLIRGMLGSGGRRRLVTSLLSLTLCTGWIFAQAPRASIEGTITFAEQPDHPEAIPGIAVTLTVSSGGEPVSATTDAEGRYRFSDLSSGTYKVDVQLQGFKHVSETIALRDGSAATVNVAMELEKVVESIEVRDKTATVPTD